MAATPLSPQASPRLPSPPPIAEDQIGPTSPSPSKSGAGGPLDSVVNIDNGASRRIRPGTKAADMPEGPPVIDISEIDTAYQLTEHLKALYNAEINSKDLETTIPVDHEIARRLATPPKDIDRAIWLYELCRFLCQQVNSIIIALFADEPPCSAQTCNEMRASEWQYLCAVHDPPKPCCAIDYCCHTLDWAANVLTSQKHFPSRMALGSEQGASHQQMRQLTNIFRRVYRIFAHAWFQHREMFWKVETRTGLYMFFKTVCEAYSLIPEDGYTIPPEAESKEPASVRQHQSLDELPLLNNSSNASRKEEAYTNNAASGLAISSLPHILPSNAGINTGHTTKRHRQNPSMDTGAISTVIEETEEDDNKSVAESIMTTIEEGLKNTSLESEALEAPASLGSLSIPPPQITNSDEQKSSAAEDALSPSPSEVQISAVAVQAMEDAISAAEIGDTDAKDQPVQILASEEPTADIPAASAPSVEPEPTTSTSEVAPNSADIQSEEDAKFTDSSSPPSAAKMASPKIKSDEPKSKIPVAKKDTPSKESKNGDAKVKEDKSPVAVESSP